ncbi:zinc finger protein 454-like [Leguminivora glycinivorella]|uniref:zinc finger protein 454-like n=1 Tax=Leguminivora glycinivorella TaxID=1035111 RepID=UPI00200C8710|nr:zinc finger protein 454-like [Leguminivora glycinivorella]XP_047986266.1 zinc finger protein 454-like [Leguminivora glycinivorella]
MECLLHSESGDEAKPFETAVQIKEETGYETMDPTRACRPDLYDVHVKVEPLENLDVEVACLTTGTIKKESLIVDAEFEDMQIVTSYDSQIEVCITKESSSSPTEDEFVINKDFLQCSICHKIFDDNINFKIHRLTHDEDKSKLKKKKTNNNACQNKESITCKICELQFTSLSTYNKHRKIHLPDKPFKCAFCVKAFNSNFLLANHERIHTGKNLFLVIFVIKNLQKKLT